jgi:hypothetical protein
MFKIVLILRLKRESSPNKILDKSIENTFFWHYKTTSLQNFNAN